LNSPTEKKKQDRSCNCKSFIVFLLNLCIGLPVWLCILVPLTIVWKIISFPINLCRKKSKPVRYEPTSKPVENVVPRSERKYDVVVFGATGFTGKLAAEHIAKTYGKSVKWAIAGRSAGKLEAIRTYLTKFNSELKDLDVLIADSSKPESLEAVVSSTRAVISTVGPFVRYGSPLVASCAHNGTHYCDITGEVGWVRKMIESYDDVAKKTGATLVSCCGCDSVPWDISTFAAANYLKENNNEGLKRIQFFDEMAGAASGGTLETLFESMAHPESKKTTLGYDPLLKIPGTKDKAAVGLSSKIQGFLGYSSLHKTWVGPWALATGNSLIVKRSNAILNYSGEKNLQYEEALVYPTFSEGFNEMFGMIIFGTSLFFYPLCWLMRTFVLPKPGEGPSREVMESAFLNLVGYATGTNGTKITCQLYFHKDPGYLDTGRMLAEAGLTLGLDEDKLPTHGGYLTPASGLGKTYLQRLLNTGCKLDIQADKK